MTEKNYAIIAYAQDDVRVEEIPFPQAQPDQAIIRIEYGGICGSDLGYWKKGAAGQSILRDPMILGHEVSGTVYAQAADGSGPAVQTPVVVHPATPKGVWPEGKANLASEGTYLGSAARRPHKDGAFARYVALPTSMLRTVNPDVSLQTAALAEPGAVAFHALERAGDVRGKTVLIIGAGPIGSLLVAAAHRAGATNIVVTDVHEHALQVARQVGATTTYLASQTEEIGQVRAQVVFESSGSHYGLAAAIQGAAPAARLVMVGLLPAGEQPALIAMATTKELELVGSFRFVNEIDEVVAALEDGTLKAEPIITNVFDARDALTAFEVALDASKSCKVLVHFTD